MEINYELFSKYAAIFYSEYKQSSEFVEILSNDIMYPDVKSTTVLSNNMNYPIIFIPKKAIDYIRVRFVRKGDMIGKRLNNQNIEIYRANKILPDMILELPKEDAERFIIKKQIDSNIRKVKGD